MAKFIIYNTDTQKYFGNRGKGWTNEIQNAAVFNSEDAANNAMKVTYRLIFTPEVMQHIEVKDQHAVSIENINECYEQFEEALKLLNKSVGNLESLLTYYHEEELRQTGMQQDLLHKIEFDNSITGIQSIKYMRILKKVRKDRRVAKDREEILTEFKNNGGGRLVEKMIYAFGKQNGRKYEPRQMPELFSENN